MTLLAATPGFFVLLVIALIVGVVKHFGKKLTEANLHPPRDEAPRRAGGSEEEEKTRKFLEALGLPADALHEKHHPPAPPLVVSPLRQPRAKRRAQPPPLQHAPAHREVTPTPFTPPQRIERIHLPELQTPEVPEYHTRSSQVMAIPFEGPGSVAAPKVEAEPPITLEVRELVRRPGSLRAAMLLREILGPPRGLQSPGALSTLPLP